MPWGIPMAASNFRVQEKIQDYHHHQRRVKTITKTIDDSAPAQRPHLDYRYKALQKEEEHMSEIDNNNRILLGRIKEIMYKPHGTVDHWNRYKPRSLNYKNREKALAKVIHDNYVFAERLKGTKSNLGAKEFHAHTEQYDRLLKKLANPQMTPTMSSLRPRKPPLAELQGLPAEKLPGETSREYARRNVRVRPRDFLKGENRGARLEKKSEVRVSRKRVAWSSSCLIEKPPKSYEKDRTATPSSVKTRRGTFNGGSYLGGKKLALKQVEKKPDALRDSGPSTDKNSGEDKREGQSKEDGPKGEKDAAVIQNRQFRSDRHDASKAIDPIKRDPPGLPGKVIPKKHTDSFGLHITACKRPGGAGKAQGPSSVTSVDENDNRKATSSSDDKLLDAGDSPTGTLKEGDQRKEMVPQIRVRKVKGSVVATTQNRPLITDAKLLYKISKKTGFPEGTLLRTLVRRTPAERVETKAVFHRLYGLDLAAELKRALGPDWETLIDAFLTEQVPQPRRDPQVDAETRAERLHLCMENNPKDFIKTLVICSDTNIAAVRKAYRQRYVVDLPTAMDYKLKHPAGDVLIELAKKNPKPFTTRPTSYRVTFLKRSSHEPTQRGRPRRRSRPPTVDKMIELARKQQSISSTTEAMADRISLRRSPLDEDEDEEQEQRLRRMQREGQKRPNSKTMVNRLLNLSVQVEDGVSRQRTPPGPGRVFSPKPESKDSAHVKVLPKKRVRFSEHVLYDNDGNRDTKGVDQAKDEAQDRPGLSPSWHSDEGSTPPKTPPASKESSSPEGGAASEQVEAPRRSEGGRGEPEEDSTARIKLRSVVRRLEEELRKPNPDRSLLGGNDTGIAVGKSARRNKKKAGQGQGRKVTAAKETGAGKTTPASPQESSGSAHRLHKALTFGSEDEEVKAAAWVVHNDDKPEQKTGEDVSGTPGTGGRIRYVEVRHGSSGVCSPGASGSSSAVEQDVLARTSCLVTANNVSQNARTAQKASPCSPQLDDLALAPAVRSHGDVATRKSGSGASGCARSDAAHALLSRPPDEPASRVAAICRHGNKLAVSDRVFEKQRRRTIPPLRLIPEGREGNSRVGRGFVSKTGVSRHSSKETPVRSVESRKMEERSRTEKSERDVSKKTGKTRRGFNQWKKKMGRAARNGTDKRRVAKKTKDDADSANSNASREGGARKQPQVQNHDEGRRRSGGGLRGEDQPCKQRTTEQPAWLTRNVDKTPAEQNVVKQATTRDISELKDGLDTTTTEKQRDLNQYRGSDNSGGSDEEDEEGEEEEIGDEESEAGEREDGDSDDDHDEGSGDSDDGDECFDESDDDESKMLSTESNSSVVGAFKDTRLQSLDDADKNDDDAMKVDDSGDEEGSRSNADDTQQARDLSRGQGDAAFPRKNSKPPKQFTFSWN